MAKKIKGEKVVLEPIEIHEANIKIFGMMIRAEGFIVPQERSGDKKWLLRNFGIKNGNHRNFDLAMQVIKGMPDEIPTLKR